MALCPDPESAMVMYLRPDGCVAACPGPEGVMSMCPGPVGVVSTYPGPEGSLLYVLAFTESSLCVVVPEWSTAACPWQCVLRVPWLHALIIQLAVAASPAPAVLF